jgi:hypothetical protein
LSVGLAGKYQDCGLLIPAGLRRAAIFAGFLWNSPQVEQIGRCCVPHHRRARRYRVLLLHRRDDFGRRHKLAEQGRRPGMAMNQSKAM